MRLRRREHARSVAAAADRAGPVVCHQERCEFTGGRDDDTGGSTLFGGSGRRADNVSEPPGGHDDLAPPVPTWPVEAEELSERLREFTSWLGGDVVLRHHTVSTSRTVVAGDGPVRRRVRTMFALTGRALTANGRTLPIGISGAGDGLAVLGDQRVAESLAWTRTALAAAGPTVLGRPPAVLSPQASALIVHEAVGHYAEAMHVGAPAVHRLFTRIADECLSIMDEPAPPDGGHHHDDEGVLSLGPTEVVRRGMLVAQLHSRATARAAAAGPTGNARAAQVWDPPIPRMSTLVCAPGTQPKAALVGALGSGVYIHRLADGYRQGTRVCARVVLGEHVERGRLTGRYFTGGGVDGGLDLLTGLVELSDQAERSPNAMCGKDGQLLFDVGTVAPAMRLATLPLVR